MSPCELRLCDWAEAAALAAPLRHAVFVVEQGVPEDMELDEFDVLSRHALALDAEGQLLGTGRLLPDGHIGRLAVAASARATGVGSALLRALIDEARRRGLAEVQLNAQTSALGFYLRHGFEAVGGCFMEAGIEHQAMRLGLGT